MSITIIQTAGGETYLSPLVKSIVKEEGYQPDLNKSVLLVKMGVTKKDTLQSSILAVQIKVIPAPAKSKCPNQKAWNQNVSAWSNTADHMHES